MNISIITVCLNAAPVLERTIKSVLEQNYPKFEYIIVDGGSTDGTREILDKYKARLARVISEPDKGIYDAFNKGISLSTGDVVGILNAGDLYSPWALSAVAEAAEANPANPECGVFYGRTLIVDAALRKWTLYSSSHDSHESLRNHMSIPHAATFVRKNLYERYGLFDDSYAIAGDWDLMLRFYMAGERFRFIDKVLAAFDNAGVSSVVSRRLAAENRRVYFKHLDFFSAMRKTIKFELRRFGRKLLDVTGLYGTYARYRDGNILHVDAFGIYTDDDIWGEFKELAKRRR